MNEPEIRAGLVKDFLSQLERPGVTHGAAVIARIDPEFVRSVRDGSRLARIPAAPMQLEPGGESDARLIMVHCPAKALTRGMLVVFAGTIEGAVAPMCRSVSATIDHSPGDSRAEINIHWQ